jgi:hypothetical protein
MAKSRGKRGKKLARSPRVLPFTEQTLRTVETLRTIRFVCGRVAKVAGVFFPVYYVFEIVKIARNYPQENLSILANALTAIFGGEGFGLTAVLLFFVLGAFAMYGWLAWRLSNRRIKHVYGRIQRYERSIDRNRSSAAITAEGKTPTEED